MTAKTLREYASELVGLAKRMESEGHNASNFMLGFAIGSMRNQMSENDALKRVDSAFRMYAGLRLHESKPEEREAKLVDAIVRGVKS